MYYQQQTKERSPKNRIWRQVALETKNEGGPTNTNKDILI